MLKQLRSLVRSLSTADLDDADRAEVCTVLSDWLGTIPVDGNGDAELSLSVPQSVSVAGVGLAFAADAAQLCRPAKPASTRTCAAARLCRFKPCSFPNENGPHKGTHFSFGSRGVICTVPTEELRVRIK